MVTHDVFEIVLRVQGGTDYSVFEVDADTTLYELEGIISFALEKFFVLEGKPND